MEIWRDENNNTIYGYEHVKGSTIVHFSGKGNILYLEDTVKLQDTTLSFNGSDSCIYIRGSRHIIKLNATVYNQCTLAIGKDNYFNGKLNIIVSEQTMVGIGDDGLFSFGIWVRTADPHLIYDISSHERINPSKSVFIGDHVWVGQGAMLLKGSHLGSGCIVGGAAVVSGKKLYSNAVYAGNPAKEVKRNIFWEGSCVHSWTKAEQEKNSVFMTDDYCFAESEDSINIEAQEDYLKNAGDAQARLARIRDIYENNQNYRQRFAISPKEEKSMKKKFRFFWQK